MHFLGLAGMPRRIPDYPDAYSHWNLICSLGGFLSGFGSLLFLFIVGYTLLKGKKAADNPWGDGAKTLEWTLPSPAPWHTFENLPRIA